LKQPRQGEGRKEMEQKGRPTDIRHLV
jgi:hypothetical protein